MKVLGVGEEVFSNRKYIVEISSRELQIIENAQYGKPDYLHLERLKPGDEINLTLVHDYYNEIVSTFKKMQDTVEKFESVKDIVYNFSRIFGPKVDNEKDS